jgi:hypothetical protein
VAGRLLEYMCAYFCKGASGMRRVPIVTHHLAYARVVQMIQDYETIPGMWLTSAATCALTAFLHEAVLVATGSMWRLLHRCQLHS